MKAVGIALAAALAMATSASADEFPDNAVWIQVKYDLLKAKWPHDANGNLVYGRVLLDCAIGANQFASDCKVKASDPQNPAAERAALELSRLYRTWTGWDSGHPRVTLLIDMRYDEPPEPLRKPSYEQMMAVYPPIPRKSGASDIATIRCIVQTTGIGRDCSVVSESRPGLGFGSAGLAVAQTLLFSPAMRHGQPVEADITLPLRFALGNENEAPTRDLHTSDVRRTTRVLTGAAWAKAPTVSDILDQIDKKVGDKFADGQVVMQCELNKKNGKLGGCKVVRTSSGMAQFTGVANALTAKFQANPAELGGIKENIAINLAFAFPDMSSPEWGKRYLTKPDWLQTFDPKSNTSSFPETAAKAGLKTGAATVDCVVAPNGALTQCQTVSESTPNVGFGDTAIKIAEAFVANPWNEDGLPNEGAHVRMPIQMDYTPPAAPAPTPATKP